MQVRVMHCARVHHNEKRQHCQLNGGKHPYRPCSERSRNRELDERGEDDHHRDRPAEFAAGCTLPGREMISHRTSVFR